MTSGHTVGASHGETGHECDAECMHDAYRRACGCRITFWGRAICEERSGTDGTYCLAEQQAEEEARTDDQGVSK